MMRSFLHWGRSVLHRFRYWVSDNGLKIVAGAFIVALAFSDFFAMKNLFLDLSLMSYHLIGEKEVYWLSESNVYAFTFAILLEGNPLFIGIAASALADKTKFKVNDRVIAKFGFWISLVAFILTISLVFCLRILLIIHYGGFESFFDLQTFGGPDKPNENFIAQIYLVMAPLLTSLLAFVASWTAFKSESISKLEFRLEKLHNRFLDIQSRFLDTVHRNDDARTALWGSLAAKDKSMPTDLDTFRRECFDRIRSKIITNAITEFPDQIEHFNAEIAGLLQSFIGDIREKTTSLPGNIEKLNIQNILDEYDQRCISEQRSSEIWKYSICKTDLETELTTVLNNAVVVAQFKTTTKPYRLEGDF